MTRHLLHKITTVAYPMAIKVITLISCVVAAYASLYVAVSLIYAGMRSL